MIKLLLEWQAGQNVVLRLQRKGKRLMRSGLENIHLTFRQSMGLHSVCVLNCEWAEFKGMRPVCSMREVLRQRTIRSVL